jgi:hypothetical protein
MTNQPCTCPYGTGACFGLDFSGLLVNEWLVNDLFPGVLLQRGLLANNLSCPGFCRPFESL